MNARQVSRRKFLLGAAASTLLVSCQPGVRSERTVTIGWLALASSEAEADSAAALRAALNELGRGFTILERYADGNEEQLPTLARDLLANHVDLIVTSGTDATLAAIRTTSRVPVVFTNVGDPLGSGLVYDLARPGGNATGISSVSSELAGKRLELLKTAVPRLARVAVLWSAGAEQDVFATRTSANWLGVQVAVMPPVTATDVQTSLQAALDSGADALVAISTPVIDTFNAEIARFASTHSLPSIAEERGFVSTGGLLAYGANTTDLCRRAAFFVEKISSGSSPADLPVERADRFELAVNLKTAQTLKLVLPESLLLRAAEVVL